MITKNIKLRNRGQITIPKEILEQLDVRENDFITIYYDNSKSGNKKITLEFVSNNEINITDDLDKYIISEFIEKGYDNQTIEKMLPKRKEEIEDNYLKYLLKLEEQNDFSGCEDWEE